MLLKRCAILVLCIQIVSALCYTEDATTTRKHKTFRPHARHLKKPMLRTLQLKQNPVANVEELSQKGRFLKTYDVITCDGYILSVFRLTFQNNGSKLNEYPVILVPGLFQSSDRFVKESNEESLAFLLQDLGYDVWLANYRGNKYGRRHLYLEPDTDDHAKYFNYTYEEIGFYDIAVTVDYILNDTSKQKVHYIGHSLGGTVFLVLNSLLPQYNDKFETAHLLAPIGYQNYFPNSDLAKDANRFDEIYKCPKPKLISLQGDLIKQNKAEIFPFGSNYSKLFSIEECLGDKNYQNVCRGWKIDQLMSLDQENNPTNRTRGGSIKLLAHLAQNIKSKTFGRWSYGQEENNKQYKTQDPPKYDLSLITVPTKIIYAPSDEFVSSKDIADMAKHMVNATTREIGRKSFTHQDFIAAPDVKDKVYKDIIDDLRNMSRIITQSTIELIKEESATTVKLDKEAVVENLPTTTRSQIEPNNKEEDPTTTKSYPMLMIKQEYVNPITIKTSKQHEDQEELAEYRQKNIKLITKEDEKKTNPEQNTILSIPASWWRSILVWLPRVLLPIVIIICITIFLCYFKKVGLFGSAKGSHKTAEQKKQ